YLKYCIFGVALIGIVVYFLYSILTPKPKSVLNIAFINSNLSQEKSSFLEKELGHALDIDPEKECVSVDTSLYIDTENPSQASMASEQKLSIYTFNGDYDLVIADSSTFKRYAEGGYFEHLTESLPSNLYNDFTDRFLMAKAADQDTEEMPYGISLRGYKNFENLDSCIVDPVLGILASSKNTAKGIDVLDWMVEKQ
ncbi:MAG: hypothetical protein RR237_02920, partial [Acetivibrio sp.]